VCAVPSFLLGAAPWWIWNLTHDCGSLTYVRSARGPGFAPNLRQFARDGLRVAFGLYQDGESTQRRHVTSVLAVIVVAALVVVAVAAVRRALRGRAPVPLDVIGFAMVPFVYAALPFRVPFVVPRYFVFVWPFASILIGRLAVRRWTTAAVGCALAAILAVNLTAYLRAPLHAADVTPVRQVLEQAGRTTFYGDYWSVYRLVFDTDEHLIGSTTYTSRWPQYDRIVRAAPQSAYVLPHGMHDLDVIAQAARAHGMTAELVPAGAYDVLLLDGQLPPEAVTNRVLGLS
jgi:hypothetical protein